MKTYNYHQTLHILNQIVADKPEGYGYREAAAEAGRPALGDLTNCRYQARSGSGRGFVPLCIVGQFFHREGVPLPQEGVNLLGVLNHVDMKKWTYAPLLPPGQTVPVVGFTTDAAALLHYTQRYQDIGVPWRKAIDGAVALIAEDQAKGQYHAIGRPRATVPATVPVLNTQEV